MITSLQHRKASYYFDLVDADDNGLIEADDFEYRADRLAETRDQTAFEERAALRDKVMDWWDHLCAVADFDDDDRVTREEWATYWEAIQASVDRDDADQTIASLEKAARGTFHAISTDGSPITASEYAEWLAAWDVEPSEAAFRRLDRDGSGTLTEDDLIRAVKEFYLSDDPAAPGNALYGELPE